MVACKEKDSGRRVPYVSLTGKIVCLQFKLSLEIHLGERMPPMLFSIKDHISSWFRIIVQ
jgi:hypothetical protein